MLDLIGRQTQVRLENGDARFGTISALADRGGRPFGSSLPTLRSKGQWNDDRRRHTHDREAGRDTLFHDTLPSYFPSLFVTQHFEFRCARFIEAISPIGRSAMQCVK